ncbi:hypothetical protein [Nostoc sp.]|uniref:hypothetical protein n=1 Tax=Nostoc sp. TaxID=1180 RepID=UPI002FF7C42A
MFKLLIVRLHLFSPLLGNNSFGHRLAVCALFASEDGLTDPSSTTATGEVKRGNTRESSPLASVR